MSVSSINDYLVVLPSSTSNTIRGHECHFPQAALIVPCPSTEDIWWSVLCNRTHMFLPPSFHLRLIIPYTTPEWLGPFTTELSLLDSAVLVTPQARHYYWKVSRSNCDRNSWISEPEFFVDTASNSG